MCMSVCALNVSGKILKKVVTGAVSERATG